MKKIITVFAVVLCFFSFMTVDAKSKTKTKKSTAKVEEKAEKKEEKKEVTKVSCDNKINVYIFHGDGCPHCAEALEFFESIKEEYSNCFELKKFEVWYNEENSNLMQTVANYMGEQVSGVPYIVIGQSTFKGYSSAYSDQIKQAIVDTANKDADFDVVNKVLGTSGDVDTDSGKLDTIVTIAIIAVVVGGVVALVLTSKGSRED